MDFNFDYLRTFLYVAQSGSISKASEKLFLTQPAVSSTIKKLEDQLDVVLLNRSNKGVELTDKGLILYSSVKLAFDLIDSSISSLRASENALFGNLNICATESPLYHFLPKILGEFQKNYPNVKINIKGSATSDCISSLIDGKADLAFLVSPLHLKRSLAYTKLMDLQDVFCYSPQSYPQLTNRQLSLLDLVSYPIICVEEGTSAREHLKSFFATQGLELEPSFSVRTSTVVLELVKNGMGIGVVPKNFLPADGIKKVNTCFTIPMRETYLAINRRFPKSKICSIFIEYVKGSIRSFQEEHRAMDDTK